MDQDRAASNSPSVDRTSVRMRLDSLRQKALFRIAAAYAVAAWLVIQVAATIAPAFDLSPWLIRAIILLAVLGFIATIGYFGVLRAADRETANDLQRRNRFANRAAFVVLLVAALAGAGYVARQSLFANEPVSLAVLPFADLSPGRDKAYFAEGVAEEILSALAANKDFKVLGRTSARQIERELDPQAIRATLGVTHLLEGSARTSGDQLRVNVRLIDTGDGAQLWEEEYDGRLADVFVVQDKIAGAVVRRLRGTLIERAPDRQIRTPAIDSYQTYLAARALMRDRAVGQLNEALVLARRLVASDPGYAKGQALLAELIYMLSDDGTAYGDMPVDQARRLAIPHAMEAIRLAPDRAEGYAALGLVETKDRRIAPLQRAIALDPARAEVRIWLGIALTALGRNDEAYVQYRAAADTEPLWPVSINRLTQTLAASGRQNEAESTIRQYRQRGGSEAQALRFTGYLRRMSVDLSGAIVAEHAGLARDPRLPYVAGWLVREYHLLGLPRQALSVGNSRGQGRFRQLWVSGDRQGLQRLARSAPAALLTAPDAAEAIFALGAMRDWSVLRQLVEIEPGAVRELCLSQGVLVPQMIIALRQTGQGDQSRRLIECMRRNVDRSLPMTMRSPDEDPGRLEFRKASVLALSGDRSAIAWLDRAVKRGWVGQYYSSQFADWPQFDALRGDPRIATLQRRIDATIARERAETLRDLQRRGR